MPKANTAGIIASPARIAMIVSAIGITNPDLAISSFLSMYEPYVTRIPIPSDTEKNICPPAAARTLIQPVPWNTEKSGLNIKLIPAPAPSSVHDLTTTMRRRTKSAGMANLLNFSIPPLTPRLTMMIVRAMKIRVYTADSPLLVNRLVKNSEPSVPLTPKPAPKRSPKFETIYLTAYPPR